MIDTWAEPKAIIPNTEPNLDRMVLYSPQVWVVICNSRVGIAFGSVVQTCGDVNMWKGKMWGAQTL